MKFNRSSIPIFIPYVNRPDLLATCLASLSHRLITHPVVINNSGGYIPNYVYLHWHGYVDFMSDTSGGKPPTFSQTQNMMLRCAVEAGNPFYFFMHSDAIDNEGILDNLFDMAMQQTQKWGAIFTSYDALACFNTDAMLAVGGWDENIPWYRSDCDMYRRLRLAGYPTLESGLKVFHEPSQTLKSDPAIKDRVYEENKASRLYYIRKWGGDNEQEKYEVPFNGQAS